MNRLSLAQIPCWWSLPTLMRPCVRQLPACRALKRLTHCSGTDPEPGWPVRFSKRALSGTQPARQLHPSATSVDHHHDRSQDWRGDRGGQRAIQSLPRPARHLLAYEPHHGGRACGPRQRHCLRGTAFIARPPVASMCCTRVSDPNRTFLLGFAKNSSPFCKAVIV